MKKFKVYLKDAFNGEVTAVNEKGEINILKVWPEQHEGSGQILAYFCIATPAERDALWESGLACNRAAAMGLIAPPLSRGDAPVKYDDPIPDHHKISENDQIEDDPVDLQGFADEFETGEEEIDLADDDRDQESLEPAPNVLGVSDQETPTPHPLPTDQKIEAVVSLSAPIRARLKSAGLTTVNDLVDKSIDDLEAVPGIGKTTASKLFDAMNQFRDDD